ncbi:hypothetical protein [Microbacterium sp.]|uniref:hypothetical protein n=1 Tax=Microbacterium sp. TaxID=51671 RepID=UPI002624F680|nr:hypothetical protein [Microbacterium sp.]
MTTAKKAPQDRKPKATENLQVAGVTLSVPADVVKERLADWDVAEMMAVLQDEDAQPGERLAASVKVLKFVLADDYAQVKADLRAANDGKLTETVMSEFMASLFEAIAPNS